MRTISFLALSLILIAPAVAQTPAEPTLSEKAAHDTTDVISGDDPVMAEAVVAARKTLPDFLAAAAAPKPGTDKYAVKVGLGPKGGAEFVWITRFIVSGNTLTGVLGNKPERIIGYRAGQMIRVRLADVTDWMYVSGTTMKGNYSACALLKHKPPEEAQSFKRDYGLDCADH